MGRERAQEWLRLSIVGVRLPPEGLSTSIDRRTATRLVLAVSLAVVAIAFVHAHDVDPMRPTAPVVDNGYWWWWDQSRYLVAALAWSHGNLEAANHWYFPGYGMLGALFVQVTPAEPFVMVDLLCLLATLCLCSALAAAVAPHRAWSGALGAVAFAAVFLDQPLIRHVWVVPWTTTPATVLEVGALLVAIRFQGGPTARDAFLAALCATGLVLFRPIDAMVTLVVLPPAMAIALVRNGRGSSARIVGAAAGGAVLPLIVFIAAHLATHGFARSEYMVQSAAIGFEWRLVALRWVTLVIDPRPLFPSGRGLAEVFHWMIPGMAALVLGSLGRLGGPVRRHLIVLGFVAATMLAYLAYRDLHPQGLWRFNNYHYFKCVLALLAVYAALLVQELVLSPLRLQLGAGSLVLIAALVCWRADWHALPPVGDPPRVTGPHELIVPSGLDGPTEAVRLHAAGDFRAIFLGQHRLRVGAKVFDANSDFKAFPVANGLLFTTLRVLAPGSATEVPTGSAIAKGGRGSAPARQRLRSAGATADGDHDTGGGSPAGHSRAGFLAGVLRRRCAEFGDRRYRFAVADTFGPQSAAAVRHAAWGHRQSGVGRVSASPGV